MKAAFQKMISVQAAIEIIENATNLLQPVTMTLNKAAGLVLAEEIIAPYTIPAYPQSSMDGYALKFGIESGNSLELVGEMAAGSSQEFSLQPGQAVRIFTGAAVPQGADTVVMQEKAMVTNEKLFIKDDKLKTGDNVRPVGSEIESGAIALPAGAILTPAALGFLAGMGLTTVQCYPLPKVSVLVTGNELQQPGEPLQYGQVYESNSVALSAALKQLHISVVQVDRCTDDPKKLAEQLAICLDKSDLVLMTGGVSVGDYDFTFGAFEQNDVLPLFHKIKQKPGKPLLLGTKDNKLVFGLPGNPSSVLTCFYEYVLPAIEKMTQLPSRMLRLQAPLTNGFKKAPGLTQFVKALYNGTHVTLLTGQESYKLNSFARANCLAILSEETTELSAGQMVDIHLLPV